MITNNTTRDARMLKFSLFGSPWNLSSPQKIAELSERIKKSQL